VLGAPELAGDPRFATNSDRVTHRAVLKQELLTRLAAAPAAEWAQRLTAARVPAGVVNDLAGAFALAQAVGLDPIVQVPSETDPPTPPVALTRNPIGLSRTPPTYRNAPPALPDR
jgi:crotonobetainyl-CoA:carnitine CoA-transferase CaiB-like acyl-CoA transferase